MRSTSIIICWVVTIAAATCTTGDRVSTDETESTDQLAVVGVGAEKELTGRIVVEAADDNGLLLQSTDGQLWVIEGNEIRSKEVTDRLFQPLESKSLGKQLKADLGEEFKIHEAGNFVIVHNTETEYARWVAGLYRRLERGFKAFWKKKRFKLAARPEFHLPILLFRTEAEYHRFMAKDLGVVNREMLAYYNLKTNRVAMYDLTNQNLSGGTVVSNRNINEVLNNPRAIPMVATIIHEGVHQLMFNYGMQVRFSDTPLWVNEGMAMYFETPDLSANRGWRKIGIVNPMRLKHFRSQLNRRNGTSLESMIAADDEFRGEAALDQYAQAWAFNYFLINQHTDEFVDYLEFLSKKPAAIRDSPETRVKEFESFFDLSIEELDREFIQYIQRL